MCPPGKAEIFSHLRAKNKIGEEDEEPDRRQQMEFWFTRGRITCFLIWQHQLLFEKVSRTAFVCLEHVQRLFIFTSRYESSAPFAQLATFSLDIEMFLLRWLWRKKNSLGESMAEKAACSRNKHHLGSMPSSVPELLAAFTCDNRLRSAGSPRYHNLS